MMVNASGHREYLALELNNNVLHGHVMILDEHARKGTCRMKYTEETMWTRNIVHETTTVNTSGQRVFGFEVRQHCLAWTQQQCLLREDMPDKNIVIRLRLTVSKMCEYSL
jgi:hypothetical protein